MQLSRKCSLRATRSSNSWLNCMSLRVLRVPFRPWLVWCRSGDTGRSRPQTRGEGTNWPVAVSPGGLERVSALAGTDLEIILPASGIDTGAVRYRYQRGCALDLARSFRYRLSPDRDRRLLRRPR